LTSNLDTINLGEPQIKQDDVGLECRYLLNSRLSVGSYSGVGSGCSEDPLHDGSNLLIVLNYKKSKLPSGVGPIIHVSNGMRAGTRLPMSKGR
jgi:hypothetical protein